MSRRQEVGVGLLLLAGAAATGFLAVQMGAMSWFPDRIDVTAPAVDVAGLQEGYVVTTQGVPIGKVGAIERVDGAVVVHLVVERSAGVRSDVTPRIRAKSLLGEKYVELAPGGQEAPLLENGDVIAPIREQFEIDELVDLIGPVVAAFDPATLADLAEAVKAMHEQDPERFGRMLADLEVVMANGRIASEELPALVREGRATLAQARVTLGTVDARAMELEDALSRADGLLANLEAGASNVPATVDEAHQALVEARALLAKLDGATVDLETILHNFSTLDPAAIERLLRDEGIRVRFAGRGEKR
jgi:phospholipid/cholesterol/gamma-HCH transport system substrate-binding protein